MLSRRRARPEPAGSRVGTPQTLYERYETVLPDPPSPPGNRLLVLPRGRPAPRRFLRAGLARLAWARPYRRLRRDRSPGPHRRERCPLGGGVPGAILACDRPGPAL